jgi:hypothetical protein
MHRLSQLFRSRNGSRGHKPARPRPRLSLEALEDRNVMSTASSIAASFNGTAIPAGDTIWFNSAFTATGLPKTAPTTLHVVNGAIDFTVGTTPYHVPVPNAVIVLTPGATSASTSFDPTDNDWDVYAPSGGTGDVFMGGVELPVPSGLPGGIKNVTWSADFWSDTAGITVNWKWAAAVYKPGFSTDYNALGVKPVDNKDMSVYHNGDQSGAPEAFKSYVTGGATGGGGTNYTGNFTPAKGVKPTLGDGMQDYPFPSSYPLTNVAFNESTVLRAANLDVVNGYFEVWYNDEHALALGVSQVTVKTTSGTTTTNYPVAPLTSNPGYSSNPAVGAPYYPSANLTPSALALYQGSQTVNPSQPGASDASGRPMAPSLYITDITNDPNSRSGDWQYGGTAYAPSDVFGTWKAFTETIDLTTSTVTVTTTADPAKNNWTLGSGSDTPPAGLTNEGYGAEVRWNLNDLYSQGKLVAGHNYRFYVMVHDGDQNKTGGDAGQASFSYNYPGPASPQATAAVPSASISGFVYLDNNGSQTFDSSVGSVDTGINMVQVTLTGTVIDSNNQAHSVSITVMTDSTGFYSFSGTMQGTYDNQAYTFTGLPPGTYTLNVPVTGYTLEVSNLGTDNGTTDGTVLSDGSLAQIVLQAGDTGINYDFGYYPAGF